MKYFYSEIDEITLTFGDIHLNSYGREYIRIYFERPKDNGFDFLESTLPTLEIKKFAGFNDAEIKKAPALRQRQCIFNLGYCKRKIYCKRNLIFVECN